MPPWAVVWGSKRRVRTDQVTAFASLIGTRRVGKPLYASRSA